MYSAVMAIIAVRRTRRDSRLTTVNESGLC